MSANVALVAGALRSAGHPEAHILGGREVAGFWAVPYDGSVIVSPVLGDDQEGHWDSPGWHAKEARITGEYREALEAAGWVAQVSARGPGLVVTGRAKAAR